MHGAQDGGAERDPRSRAAWVGLTLGHDRRHLLRALLEGVAFSFRSIQDWVESQGAEVRDVRCVGGQAHSLGLGHARPQHRHKGDRDGLNLQAEIYQRMHANEDCNTRGNSRDRDALATLD